MNAKRRSAIDELYRELVDIQEEISSLSVEEQEYYYNMPEGIQGGEKGEHAQEAFDALECAVSSINDACDSLVTAMEQ